MPGNNITNFPHHIRKRAYFLPLSLRKIYLVEKKWIPELWNNLEWRTFEDYTKITPGGGLSAKIFAVDYYFDWEHLHDRNDLYLVVK